MVKKRLKSGSKTGPKVVQKVVQNMVWATCILVLKCTDTENPLQAKRFEGVLKYAERAKKYATRPKSDQKLIQKWLRTGSEREPRTPWAAPGQRSPERRGQHLGNGLNGMKFRCGNPMGIGGAEPRGRFLSHKTMQNAAGPDEIFNFI